MKAILCVCSLCIIVLCSKAQIITTVAGNGTAGYGGNGGLATLASVGFPGLICFDDSGNYYIGEFNSTIRKVSYSGIVSIFAGTGTAGFSGDSGPAIYAKLNLPEPCYYKGNLYIADQGNNRIRKINISTGIITTIAGTGVAGYGGDNRMAISALLNSPDAIAFDSYGNFYIADASNFRIRKVDTTGIITTIAGNGVGGFTGDLGAATDATLWVAGIHIDNHENLYIACFESVRKVNLVSDTITTVAGDTIVGYSGNGGLADSAELWYVGDVIPDNCGGFYISEQDNNVIRKVDANGIIHTIAGDHIQGYNGDSILADSAELYSPRGIALDSVGNLYIVDNGNRRIRKVTFDTPCNYLATKAPEIANNELLIYPNPTTDVLHIDGVKTGTEYRLLNITGIIEQVGTLTEGENALLIRTLPSGIHLLERLDGNGQKNISKFVKE